jgi:NAD-specific glutamate dehydrogenase
MKTVIVFDTEDLKGMEATYKIVDHLSKEYLGKRMEYSRTLRYQKIQFIKVIREFARNNVTQAEEAKSEDTMFDPVSLQNAKLFADEIFDREASKRFIK